MEDKDFWLAVRQALLMLIDAIERFVNIAPRTSELRKERREEQFAATHERLGR